MDPNTPTGKRNVKRTAESRAAAASATAEFAARGRAGGLLEAAERRLQFVDPEWLVERPAHVEIVSIPEPLTALE